MTRVWLEHKERSNTLALNLICKFAQLMPRCITRLWLWPISLYFFLFSPKAKQASQSYLRRLPDKKGSQYEIFQHFHAFSSVILDRVYFLTGKMNKFNIGLCIDPEVEALLKEENGFLLMGAHIGSFEVMRCMASLRKEIRLKVLMYRDHNAMITKVLDSLNPQIANSIINLSDENALLETKDALEHGYCVGLLGDRTLPHDKSVQCHLLGGSVDLPQGPMSIAMILGVPVVVFFGLYTGANRYRIYLHSLYGGDKIQRVERMEKIAMFMQKYADMIESKLHQHPYNWFNFYDYFGDI